MFTKKNCIPCQGGIPPLNDSEIKSFKKLVDESWKVSESKQIISEFNFSEYPKAITLLETINENLKIQTQNVFKFKKKSK